MRDSRPLWLCAVSCRLRPLRPRVARLRQCLVGVSFLAAFFTLGNNKTKSHDFSAILRQNGLFPQIAVDISRYFRTLIWDKWAISYSFLHQNRHFARQSLNTPPTPPGHFQTFLGVHTVLRNLVCIFRAKMPIGVHAANPSTILHISPCLYFILQSYPPTIPAACRQRLMDIRRRGSNLPAGLWTQHSKTASSMAR